jgi:hypothetical protein
MACSLIEEKAAWYGRTFRKIGRFEPTSQVCSACGVKDGPKPLSVRERPAPSAGRFTTGTSMPPRTSSPPGGRRG